MIGDGVLRCPALGEVQVKGIQIQAGIAHGGGGELPGDIDVGLIFLKAIVPQIHQNAGLDIIVAVDADVAFRIALRNVMRQIADVKILHGVFDPFRPGADGFVVRLLGAQRGFLRLVGQRFGVGRLRHAGRFDERKLRLTFLSGQRDELAVRRHGLLSLFAEDITKERRRHIAQPAVDLDEHLALARQRIGAVIDIFRCAGLDPIIAAADDHVGQGFPDGKRGRIGVRFNLCIREFAGQAELAPGADVFLFAAGQGDLKRGTNPSAVAGTAEDAVQLLHGQGFKGHIPIDEDREGGLIAVHIRRALIGMQFKRLGIQHALIGHNVIKPGFFHDHHVCPVVIKRRQHDFLAGQVPCDMRIGVKGVKTIGPKLRKVAGGQSAVPPDFQPSADLLFGRAVGQSGKIKRIGVIRAEILIIQVFLLIKIRILLSAVEFGKTGDGRRDGHEQRQSRAKETFHETFHLVFLLLS